MRYTHYDLGILQKGKIVEVSLKGNAANVYLLDDKNYYKFTLEEDFKSIGGYTKDPFVRRKTTHTDHWHIVIELSVPYGEVQTSYRIVKKF